MTGVRESRSRADRFDRHTWRPIFRSLRLAAIQTSRVTAPSASSPVALFVLGCRSGGALLFDKIKSRASTNHRPTDNATPRVRPAVQVVYQTALFSPLRAHSSRFTRPSSAFSLRVVRRGMLQRQHDTRPLLRFSPTRSATCAPSGRNTNHSFTPHTRAVAGTFEFQVAALFSELISFPIKFCKFKYSYQVQLWY